MDWYQKVRNILPDCLASYMDSCFPEVERDSDEPDFKKRVEDFVDMHIGKSSADDLSVKVYATIFGRREDKVRKEFKKCGW